MGVLLADSSPLQIIPELACAVGLNEAIVLQQIHYWVAMNRGKKRNFRDGHFWTYNTYSAWHKQFPFWSVRTINRVINALERRGLVVSGHYNKLQRDRTKWYRIDYDKLREVFPLCQLGAMEDANLAPPLPENTTENIIRKEDSKAREPGVSPARENFSVPENVFRRTLNANGKEWVEWALATVSFYVDKLYPKSTGKPHSKLSKAQRMVFAEKILDFINSFEGLRGDVPNNILRSILADENIPDPTIFIATSPTVLGYHAVKIKAIDYYDTMGDIYCPCEDYI